MLSEYHSHNLMWYVVGALYDLLGMFFLAAKPYRKNWMNCIDGLIVVLVGVTLLIISYHRTAMYLPGLATH